MITVFTPTYNRADTLRRLYRSLCRQTAREFEWVIVDDGSSDGTNMLVESWRAEASFVIRYFRQDKNGGKHRAINRGVAEACGELFIIVDSDDYLTDDAIEWIASVGCRIMDDDRFAGLSGTRMYPDGTRIGGDIDFDTIDTDAMLIRFKYHVRGDLAEIYKTDVLKRYPFPDIHGEKFCTEGLVWARIARDYIMRYCNRAIYIGEYLEGGLTDNSIKCRMNSPQYAMLAYSEFVRHPRISVTGKIRYLINFWLYSYCTHLTFHDKLKRIGWSGAMFAPIGFLFYLRARKHR